MKRSLMLLSLLLVLMLTLPLCAQAEESAETDWYLEKAAVLTGKLHEMIACEDFAEYFTPSQEIAALIASWDTALDAEPQSVRGYALPPMELISEFTPDMANMPDALIEKVERSLGTTLVTQINGMKGVDFLAACSMAVFSEGYVMPENFSPCIVVYEYDGVCLSVSFSRIGEGVVSATAQFTAPEIIDLLTETYEE